MKNRRILTFVFFAVQFLLAVFFNLKWISYLLLAECYFLYLFVEELTPFAGVLLYFYIDLSSAFTSSLFVVLYHFFKKRLKISVKFSILFFLLLYFFTARYEVYIFKGVLPGFIAFVALIYAITRMPLIQHDLSKALIVYTFVGTVYSILYVSFSFFSYKPYLMFSTDVIQILIALSMYYSLSGYLEKKSPQSDNEHNKGEA